MSNSKRTPILCKPSYNYYESVDSPATDLSVNLEEMISTWM